jgi:hypothetical protein
MTSNVYQNNIYNISNTGVSTGVYGLKLQIGINGTCYNNFISGLTAPASNQNLAVTGLYISTGGVLTLLHNTIVLGFGSTLTGGTDFGVSGIYWADTPNTIFENNIVSINATPNGTGTAVCLRRPYSASSVPPLSSVFTTNNNIYRINSGAWNFYYANGTINTVGNLRNAFGPNGITEDITFNIKNDPLFNTPCSAYKEFMVSLASRTSSVSDASTFTENNLTSLGGGLFAPTGSSRAESNGATGTTPSITTDFNNVARLSTPDIGALEFSGSSTNGLVGAVPPTDGSNRVATYECTDEVGWTKYFDASGYLLLSIYKNGENIGTVGDGTFSLMLGGTAGASDLSSAPYVTNTGGWAVMNRYWRVTPNPEPTSGSELNVRFYYQTADYTAVQTAAAALSHPFALTDHTDMFFYKINDINGNYNPNPANGHVSVPAARATAFNTDGYWQYQFDANTGMAGTSSWAYTSLGDNSHSAEFVVGHFGGGGGGSGSNGLGALPVSLLYFTGEKISDDAASLHWATATEHNNQYFGVMRSRDGINFEEIGRVTGAGTSESEHEYSFIDNTPNAGVNYYYLKQTDTDGKVNPTNIISLTFGKKFDIKAYPNPIQSNFFVDVYTETSEDAVLEVLDMTGRCLYKNTAPMERGLNSLSVPTESWTPGNYVLKCTSGSESFVVKIVKSEK